MKKGFTLVELLVVVIILQVMQIQVKGVYEVKYNYANAEEVIRKVTVIFN